MTKIEYDHALCTARKTVPRRVDERICFGEIAVIDLSFGGKSIEMSAVKATVYRHFGDYVIRYAAKKILTYVEIGVFAAPIGRFVGKDDAGRLVIFIGHNGFSVLFSFCTIINELKRFVKTKPDFHRKNAGRIPTKTEL